MFSKIYFVVQQSLFLLNPLDPPVGYNLFISCTGPIFKGLLTRLTSTAIHKIKINHSKSNIKILMWNLSVNILILILRSNVTKQKKSCKKIISGPTQTCKWELH